MLCYVDIEKWNFDVEIELKKIFDRVLHVNEFRKFDGNFNFLIIFDEDKIEDDDHNFCSIIRWNNKKSLKENVSVINEIKNSYFKCPREDAVLVFDFDETLVVESKNGKLMFRMVDFDVDEFFERLRRIYTKIGLWTHGTKSHVYELGKNIEINLRRDGENETCTRKKVFLNEFLKKFDFIFYRFNEYRGQKSATSLMRKMNKNFGTVKFTLSALVDDRKEMQNGDYNLFFKIDPKNVFDMESILWTIISETSKWQHS